MKDGKAYRPYMWATFALVATPFALLFIFLAAQSLGVGAPHQWFLLGGAFWFFGSNACLEPKTHRWLKVHNRWHLSPRAIETLSQSVVLAPTAACIIVMPDATWSSAWLQFVISLPCLFVAINLADALLEEIKARLGWTKA